MKKFIALLLAIVMVLGMVACGSNTNVYDETKAPVANNNTSNDNNGTESPAEAELEHLDISVAYWGVDSHFAGDPILDTVEEKFNVTFEPMNITWDDYHQKIQMWAATDELPDIFATDIRTSSSFGEWAREGIIRALPDDLSKYPNLAEYLSGEAVDSCIVDDQIYAVFRQTYFAQAEAVKDRYIIYRKDLAEAVGITEVPTNWDEFREMVLAIMKADVENKKIGGLTAPGINYMMNLFMAYTVPNAVITGATFRWEKSPDGTYVPAYLNGENLGDNVLPTFQLARDMYTEGTIDKDIALSTEDGSINKFLGGQSAAFCATLGSISQISEDWEKIYGTSASEHLGLLPLMPAADGNTYYWPNSYAWSESMFSGNVDDEKMDRICMIYDYLLSDEGCMLTRFGYEGETYDIVDGVIQYNNEARKNYPSLGTFTCLVAWEIPLPNGLKKESSNPAWIDEWTEGYVEAAEGCTLPAYEPACTTEFLALESDFGLDVNGDLLMIVTGTEPVEKMWNDILEDYKADGLMDVIDAVNAAVK